MVSEIEAQARERAAERELLLALLEAVGAEASGDGRTTLSDSDEDVLELLETKLQVKRVLSSPDIQRQYPELYEGLLAYLDAAERESLRAGRELGAADAAALVQAVARGSEAQLAPSMSEVVDRLDETGHLDELVRGLIELVEQGYE